MIVENATVHAAVASPLGELILTSDGDHVTGLRMGEAPPEDSIADTRLLKRAVAELRAYLAGELRAFTLALHQNGTPFQQSVWAELQRIPYGETIPYAELARRVGKPLAARAVGSANGRNRIGIIVPCHRVIAAGDQLGGYAGGLWRKEWLLERERSALKSRR